MIPNPNGYDLEKFNIHYILICFKCVAVILNIYKPSWHEYL